MAKKARIGRFEILDVIGRGGSGTVYACRGADGRGKVAVKCFDSARVSPQWIEQFKARARLAAQLEDPSLVRTLGAGNHQGAPYVAMELLEAVRIDERIRLAGPLPITDALVIAESMASVLDAAAVAGIDHYDIRSSKIALDKDGVARAFDIGILKPESSGLAAPTYASPEQFRGHRLDVRSQVYSLGIVLYEVLDGQPPFRAASLEDLKALHLNSVPPLLIPGASNLPAHVLNLLSGMLAKNPMDRFPDFAALAGQIDSVLRALESEPTMFSTPIPGSITNSFVLDEPDEGGADSKATVLSGKSRGAAMARTRAALVSPDTAELVALDDDTGPGVDSPALDEEDFPSLQRRRPTTAAMPSLSGVTRPKFEGSPEFVAVCLVVTAVGMLGSAAWWALGVG